MSRNARFWTYWNADYVRITLRPGQTLEVYSGRRTDEGWSRESQRWTHTGQGVKREYWAEQRDCDGRYEDGGECFCPLEQLAAWEGPIDGYPMPQWDHSDTWQRDYAAEAAGY